MFYLITSSLYFAMHSRDWILFIRRGSSMHWNIKWPNIEKWKCLLSNVWVYFMNLIVLLTVSFHYSNWITLYQTWLASFFVFLIIVQTSHTKTPFHITLCPLHSLIQFFIHYNMLIIRHHNFSLYSRME